MLLDIQSDTTFSDFKVHRDWRSALAYHGWAQSRPCVACSKKHRGVAGSCNLPRGFGYGYTVIPLQWHVTMVDSWKERWYYSQGLLISVGEWRATLSDTDPSFEDLQLPNPRSTQFRVLMSDLWHPKATHRCAHTLLAPWKFQTSGLAKCIINGDMRRDDIILENIYSQDSQGNKQGLQRKTESILGLESICCNSVAM